MMESLAALDLLCMAAVPVLAIIFVVQWIRKRPKKWVGISALICVAIIVVCTVTASNLLQHEGQSIQEIAAANSNLSQAERQGTQEISSAQKSAEQSGMSADDIATVVIVCAALVAGLILFSKFLKKAENEWENEKRSVEKTRFVKTDVRAETSTGSAVGRAIVGDLVAGPVGAMVGASTAKEKDKSESTFIVFYKDGSSNVETVANNTERYKFYLSKLER